MAYNYKGKSWTVKELAQSEHNVHNIKHGTLASRLQCGWSVTDALSLPVVLDKQVVRSKTIEGHPDRINPGDCGVNASLIESLTGDKYDLEALTAWESMFVECGALIYDTLKDVTGTMPLKPLVERLKASFDHELLTWSINTLITKGVICYDKEAKTVRLIEPEVETEATSPDQGQQP